MKLVLVLMIAIGVVPGVIFAQVSSGGGLNADGRDFYIGLLSPSFNSQQIDQSLGNIQGYYGAYLLISSYDANVVSVGYFDDLGNEVDMMTYNISQRRSIQVPLDRSRMGMTGQTTTPQWRACHVTAKKAVNVQFFSVGACSGGSYLALPTSILGSSYVVESYHDNTGGIGGDASNEDAAGLFMIIAPFDGTRVTITPTASTKTNQAGVTCGAGASGTPQPFTVGLNRGQCYIVSSTGTQTECDISGSTIVSNNPVAVIAGHENAITDGSDSQPSETGRLEARDYMVEQMIPVQYWDSTGYVSIPFLDSGLPAKDGQGDEYRVFPGILPELGAPKPDHADISINGAARTFTGVHAYALPMPNVTGVTTPVHIRSTNHAKIHVAMYDQRMQGSSSPYPCPSQMSLIPMSRWTTKYLFTVPNLSGALLQGNYINIIGYWNDLTQEHLQVSINGSTPTSLHSAGLVERKRYSVIPDHPELVGMTYVVSPGTYYFTTTGTQPFVIYSYGFQAVSPDGQLGDQSGNDMYFSYALPAGFAVAPDSGALTITVDTLCDKWRICVHDSRKYDPGIQSLRILNDPNGDYVRPGRQFYNAHFDPFVDPDTTNVIDLPGNDTIYCADVLVTDPSADAYAPVYIVDNVGNDYLVELRSKPFLLTRSVDAPATFQQNTITLPPTKLGSKSCAFVTLDRPWSAGYAYVVQIDSIRVAGKNSPFSISGLPKLPFVLRYGNNVQFELCYLSKDSSQAVDSLVLVSGCHHIATALIGQPWIEAIFSTDVQFGLVRSGTTFCQNVQIENVGNLPVTLTGFRNHDPLDFTADAESAAKLPITLAPGASVPFRFCYHPHSAGYDTAMIDWTTSMSGDYHDQRKAWSLLAGRAYGADDVPSSGKQTEDAMVATIVDDNIIVQLPASMDGTVRFELFDLLGRSVARWPVVVRVTQDEPIRLPAPSLESGAYILRASSAASTVSAKVLH